METGSILYETGNEPTLCLAEIEALRTQWSKEIKVTFKGRNVNGWSRMKPAVLSDKDSHCVTSRYIERGYNLSAKLKGSFAGHSMRSRDLRKIMT
jgi:hypothetical protein